MRSARQTGPTTTSRINAFNGLAQPNAETRFIEEEEAGGPTAESDAGSATGSAFRM
jgi:hypothetical protein